MRPISRRKFVRGSATGAFALGLAPSILSAGRQSDELRVAIVGIRSRGRSHINGFHGLKGVRVSALCDVDSKVLAREAKAFTDRGESVETFTDLRKLLEKGGVDIISIATPNHWHALQTIWACQAGMDVYVEKPVSHNVFEGRQMVAAARKYGRIVQTGTQSRSSPSLAAAVKWVHEGHIGKITTSRGLCYKPRQSIGHVSGPQGIPDHIDYDLWTGPAPMEPLMRRDLHYDWHWDFATGNGDLGNQGIHQMDICRWFLGESKLAPEVFAVGGRFGYADDGNTPNTASIVHAYAGAPLVFEVRGLPKDAESQASNWGKNMDSFMGSRIGCIIHCQNGHVVVPSYTAATAFGSDGEKLQEWKGGGDHFANFIQAVRARDASLLNADIAEGHISSALCHVGNISYLAGRAATLEDVQASVGDGAGRNALDRMQKHLVDNGIDLGSDRMTLGRHLSIDPATESILGDDLAQAMMTRNYRAPFVVHEIS
ncbi:MAG: putative dehydrogenase [Planctomycetota bacterium]|jgi:predicted dehydrogenase